MSLDLVCHNLQNASYGDRCFGLTSVGPEEVKGGTMEERLCSLMSSGKSSRKPEPTCWGDL